VNARRRRAACRQCGHGSDSHPPYIRGGDKPGYCGSCECWQWQPEHPWMRLRRPWARLLAWIRRPPAPITADVLKPRPVPYPVRDRAVREDRTLLDIPRARPFTAGQVGPRVPRQRGGSS
jgi:hypothetical protein